MKRKENDIAENWQTFSTACSELLSNIQEEIRRISKQAAIVCSEETDMQAIRLTQIAGHFASTAELIEHAINMVYLSAAYMYMDSFEAFKKKGDVPKSMSITALSVVACFYKAGNREKTLELIDLWRKEPWLFPGTAAEFDSIRKKCQRLQIDMCEQAESEE